MLYVLLFLLLVLSARAQKPVLIDPAHEETDFVVRIAGTESEVKKRLRSEGFEIVKKWNVPTWYQVRCTTGRCQTGNHQLRSAASHFEPIRPLDRRTRSDAGYLQYFITCERFDNPMPYCQNVVPVWEECVNGTGITIAVVDDGVDVQHNDLKDAIDLSRSIDINYGHSTPSPSYGATHGTACAGIVAAKPGNGVCGSGIAFASKLVGIRLLAGWPTAADEAQALSHYCESIDIYTNSWGPRDDNQRLDDMSPASRSAIEHCSQIGRGGKGSIYVWAAGNGGNFAGNTQFDGYSNSRYTISVAAVTSEGRRPSWGEIGASNLIAAASSGGSLGITTTTFNPYDKDACRNDFGGTSAAAPQIAGAVALALEARPHLTWRDVRHIVAHSGQVVDPNNAEAPWFQNAAGMKYSEAFGFGVIDVKALVKRAKSHVLLPPEKTHSTGVMTVGSIRVNPGETKTYRWTVTSPTVQKLSDAEVRIHAHFEGQFFDMARLVLVSPHGDRVRLVRAHNVPGQEIVWTFSTPAFWDTTPQGEWKLEVTNGSPSNGFFVDDVQMNIFGI